MSIKLEVGKTYTTRQGENVAITNSDPTRSWAYTGTMYGVQHTWFENGKWWARCTDNDFDLVSEYTPPPTDETQKETP